MFYLVAGCCYFVIIYSGWFICVWLITFAVWFVGWLWLIVCFLVVALVEFCLVCVDCVSCVLHVVFTLFCLRVFNSYIGLVVVVAWFVVFEVVASEFASWFVLRVFVFD